MKSIFAILKGFEMEEIEKWETQFRKGLIEALVLRAVIYQKKSYGYQLLVFLTEQGLEISEGTLYPLLNRMEKNAWLVSDWDVPKEGGHPKRVYRPSEQALENSNQIMDRIAYYFGVFETIKGLK